MKAEDIRAVILRCIFDGVGFAALACFSWAALTQPSVDAIVEAGAFVILGTTIGLILLGGLMSYGLFCRQVKTLGEVIYAPAHKRIPGPPESLIKSFWGVQLIVIVISFVIMGAIIADANPMRLILDPNLDDPFAPIKAAGRLFEQLVSVHGGVLARAIMAMVETVFMAFLATLTAVPVAFLLSFASARNITEGHLGASFFGAFLRVIFNLSRSVEPVLWAVIFSVWVGIGPFAGMLALMIHSVSSLAKQFAEIVESVEDGPIEGIRATGAGAVQTIWYAVVPQVVLPYISFTIYRWDINVRMATILGLVGGGGIGKMLIEYQGQAQWPQVGTIILVISFVVWVMDAFSAHVRSAIK